MSALFSPTVYIRDQSIHGFGALGRPGTNPLLSPRDDCSSVLGESEVICGFLTGQGKESVGAPDPSVVQGSSVILLKPDHHDLAAIFPHTFRLPSSFF